jgi:hypothetical protein
MVVFFLVSGRQSGDLLRPERCAYLPRSRISCRPTRTARASLVVPTSPPVNRTAEEMGAGRPDQRIRTAAAAGERRRQKPGESLEQADALIRAMFELADGFVETER